MNGSIKLPSPSFSYQHTSASSYPSSAKFSVKVKLCEAALGEFYSCYRTFHPSDCSQQNQCGNIIHTAVQKAAHHFTPRGFFPTCIHCLNEECCDFLAVWGVWWPRHSRPPYRVSRRCPPAPLGRADVTDKFWKLIRAGRLEHWFADLVCNRSHSSHPGSQHQCSRCSSYPRSKDNTWQKTRTSGSQPG